MRLEGKVAAITGAASGFGAAAALRFVQEGARVVVGDIQDEAGEAIAAQLGDAAVYVHCNVTDENDVAAMVDTAVERFGRLDIMFNNAGIVGAVGPISTTPAEEWKFTVDILLNGVFYGMQARGSGDDPSRIRRDHQYGQHGRYPWRSRPALLYRLQTRRGRPDQRRRRRAVSSQRTGELHRAGGHGHGDGRQRIHRRSHRD